MSATPDTIVPATRMFETVRLSGAIDPEGDPTLMHIDAVSQDEPVSGTGIGDPTLPMLASPLPERIERGRTARRAKPAR